MATYKLKTKETKCSAFTNDANLLHEKIQKNLQRKKVTRIGEFSKVAEVQISMQNQLYFYILSVCNWTDETLENYYFNIIRSDEIPGYKPTRATTSVSCNYKILMKENEDL